MTIRDYKVTSVLLCDDVRQEITGKEILIGVYTDIIVVQSFPAQLNKFVVRIGVRTKRRDYKNFTLAIRDPNQNELFNMGQEMKPSTEETIIFGAQVGNIIFAVAGKYGIYFGLDHEPELIGDFDVRAAATQEEISKLKRLS